MRETGPWDFAPNPRTEYTPNRALALLDKLFRDGAIDSGMWSAGCDLRAAIVTEDDRSEGVPSYGDRTIADPTSKADRFGRRLTGFRIEPDGSITRKGRGQSRRNERELEDMIIAACGGWRRTDNERWCNIDHARWLLATVMDSEDMATLKAMARAMGVYAENAKQGPPYALGHLHVWLGRLARYLGYSK